MEDGDQILQDQMWVGHAHFKVVVTAIGVNVQIVIPHIARDNRRKVSITRINVGQALDTA